MDDLLKPSLQDEEKLTFPSSPYSPRSQFLVSFFGGVLGGWFYSIMNTRLLKADKGTLKKMHAVWALAFVVTLIVPFVLAMQMDLYPLEPGNEMTRYLRYGNRGVAVLVNLLIGQWQRPWYARYGLVVSTAGGDQENIYGNPWVMGLISAIAVPILHGFLIAMAIQLGDAVSGA